MNYTNITTVSELFDILSLEKPHNRNIAVIDTNNIDFSKLFFQEEYVLNFYTITLKDCHNGIFFNKRNFNFDNGVIGFTKPNQVVNLSCTSQLNSLNGWILVFDKNLLETTPLFDKVDNYKFFDYQINEAISISEAEQKTITDCVNFIKNEIQSNFDNHSSAVITSILEVLLNLCKRFFERQFNISTTRDNHIVTKIDNFLKFYYENELFEEKGIPQVEHIAKYVKLSPNYLCNLLKKETGKNTKDYINYFVVEKSKHLLRNQQAYSISELAHKLGFNYPHYFSRLFKAKTGKTPQEYRKQEF
ncbi:hypothetical protein BTO06_04295 [Tenacibaculum sp. SZ-18]|uniref:helix-turn-helix domain-containing protein n=1 Tax=Tenacibaculum sp. SZ-18 TaxID=754423 RepID=UPI000C2D1733|nr:helix-turn-helix domain-containing protein [Tenacibaculum sp. SZ-18]AUC14413.1 hypothetical protein BTO06_04295 [Tenacibaculum sp. SZ-18]